MTAEPATADVVRDKAVALLAAREHSACELRQKLRKRYQDHDLIDEVIQQLVEAGYQSDARFTEARVRASLARGHGPMKIRALLREAGIDGDLVDAALEDAAPDWRDLAREALLSKFGPAPAGDQRETARRARFLASRGYPSSVIGDLLLG